MPSHNKSSLSSGGLARSFTLNLMLKLLAFLQRGLSEEQQRELNEIKSNQNISSFFLKDFPERLKKQVKLIHIIIFLFQRKMRLSVSYKVTVCMILYLH